MSLVCRETLLTISSVSTGMPVSAVKSASVVLPISPSQFEK
jgi:hypothetical protein